MKLFRIDIRLRVVAIIMITASLSACSESATGTDNGSDPTVSAVEGACGHRLSTVYSRTGQQYTDASFPMWSQSLGTYVQANGVNRTELIFDAVASGSGIIAEVTIDFPGKVPGTFSWSLKDSGCRIKIGDSTYVPLEGSTTITEVTVPDRWSAKAKGELSGFLQAPNGTKVAIKARFTGCL